MLASVLANNLELALLCSGVTIFRIVLYSTFHFVNSSRNANLAVDSKNISLFFSMSLFSKFIKLQVNCQDGDGNTGLMLAICYKKQPLVDLLLER